LDKSVWFWDVFGFMHKSRMMDSKEAMVIEKSSTQKNMSC